MKLQVSRLQSYNILGDCEAYYIVEDSEHLFNHGIQLIRSRKKKVSILNDIPTWVIIKCTGNFKKDSAKLFGYTGGWGVNERLQ